MKKLAAFLLAGLIFISGLAALASGGTSADPMLSQSYITGTYLPSVVKQAGERVDAATLKTYDDAAARLKALADLHLAKAGASNTGNGYAVSFTQQRFKRGDIITIDTGSELMLFAGSASISYESGAVIDVTDGVVCATGTAMTSRHRYAAAENTLCRVTVTSDTAVLAPKGYYAVTASGAQDYNQLAAALKAMGLFKGTGTAYGEGYDLELTPTRVEGLVLFLRLVGEERAALAFVGECPFTDVPDWARQYVSYAYQKGYTKGVDAEQSLFGTNVTITPGEYVTFLLRALGYKDSGDAPEFTWQTAIEKAQSLGIFTAGECTYMERNPFLRGQVVYLSYYALSAERKGGGTLQNHLISSGALSRSQVNSAHALVTGKRITE